MKDGKRKIKLEHLDRKFGSTNLVRNKIYLHSLLIKYNIFK